MRGTNSARTRSDVIKSTLDTGSEDNKGAVELFVIVGTICKDDKVKGTIAVDVGSISFCIVTTGKWCAGVGKS